MTTISIKYFNDCSPETHLLSQQLTKDYYKVLFTYTDIYIDTEREMILSLQKRPAAKGKIYSAILETWYSKTSER